MQVNITNGQNIIDILSDGLVTCLKVRKPVAVDWHDGAGSLGKYYACANGYESIAQELNEILTFGEDDQILKSISEFLELFASGEYNVDIIRKIKDDYELHYNYEKKSESDFFSYSYYNPGGRNLVFTQPHEILNKDRVKYYEELIENGLLPKAIIFQSTIKYSETYKNSVSRSSIDSPMFILDGHHKLIAYENLGIEPQIVVISRSLEGKDKFLQNEATLYFEYEYILKDDFKEHIIARIPKLLTDNSSVSLQYNFHFDNYLSNSRKVDICVLDLFVKALDSKEPEKIKWLVHKLELIRKRDFSKELFLTFPFTRTEYPYHALQLTQIRTLEDFDDWMIKRFGKNISEIKNNYLNTK